jgi:hypothetical protein
VKHGGADRVANGEARFEAGLAKERNGFDTMAGEWLNVQLRDDVLARPRPERRA